MKIKPEIFLNSKKKISYKKFLVTGSDETLMAYVRDFIIKDFKNRNFFIDISGNYSNVAGNLFTDKKTLFLLSNLPNKSELNDLGSSKDQYMLITLINGKKTNIKNV